MSKKEKVYTYKTTSNIELSNMSCNPYSLININDKKILLETALELAKEKEGEYYFLWSELNNYEQKHFGDEMRLMEVDYVYKYNQEIMNKIYGIKEPKRFTRKKH